MIITRSKRAEKMITKIKAALSAAQDIQEEKHPSVAAPSAAELYLFRASRKERISKSVYRRHRLGSAEVYWLR